MAEGGSDDNKNPFSYRNYMQKQSGKKSDIGDESSENDARNDDQSSSAKSTSHRNSDDNPFSFRRFLNSQGGSSRVPPTSTANPSHAGLLKTLDLANDLPDFMPDRVGSLHSHSQDDHEEHVTREINFASVILPDFARDVDIAADSHFPNDLVEQRSPLSFSPRSNRHYDSSNVGNAHARLNGGVNSPVLNNLELDDSIGEAAAAIVIDPVLPIVNSHVCELPDFLPIGALTLNGHSGNGNVSDDSSLSADELRDIVSQLRAENEQLHSQLSDMRRSSHAELRSQNQQLHDEVQRLRQKEAEDTIALDNMVKQVEANLAAATSRAVKAEKMAAKLQDELKSLQARHKHLEQENRLLAGGESSVRVLKEKATYASQQISVAASSAEDLLKQLLKGVDGLKMMSEVLASIDKVTSADDVLADSERGATGGS